jgi:outer membrane receptor protein involved in Fe transport
MPLDAPHLSAPPAVQEIVVTAERRERPLSEAPLAVTVVSGEAMARIGGRDVKDLQAVVPGLILTSTANETQTTARLRGVGTVGDNPGLESSVGVVIDGVARPRTGAAVNGLGEIDRVEVLKGPQGTLFGQNASAGVIEVLTARPVLERFAAAEATVGNLGLVEVRATLNGPLAETLAGRLHVSARRRDGLYAVRTGDGPRTEREDNDQDSWSARGQLLYQPSAAFSLRAIADYTRRDEHCCVGVQLVRGPTAAYVDALAPDEGVAVRPDIESRTAWSNRSTAQRIEDYGLSLQAEAPVGSARLTSITAARRWRNSNGYDADFSTADIYYREPGGAFGSDFRTLSEELRLTGARGRLEWLVGGYAARERLDRRGQDLFGSAYEGYLARLLSGGATPSFVSTATGLPLGQSFPAGAGARDRYDLETTTLALFTHDSWRATERLTLTAGLRVTRQEKALESRFSTTGGEACAAALARGASAVSVLCLPWSNPAFNGSTRQSREDDAWSGTLKASWRFSEPVFGYASWSRGWKAGGFNLDREQANYAVDPDTSFAEETVQAWEAGLRTRWLGGRLAADVTAFHEAFADFQLNTYANATFIVRSIPELTSTGAEVEARWSEALPGLSLSAGATYAETEFGGDVIPGAPRLADARIAFAPLWSAVGAADWTRPVGATLRIGAHLSAKYNSAYNTGSDLNPLKTQPGFWLTNARLTLGDRADRWAVELWARNLTDELHRQVVFDAPLQAGTLNAFLGEPRSFGVTLRAKR